MATTSAGRSGVTASRRRWDDWPSVTSRRQRGCGRSWRWECPAGAGVVVAASARWWQQGDTGTVTASWGSSRRRGLALSLACHDAGRCQRHGCQTEGHCQDLHARLPLSHGGLMYRGVVPWKLKHCIYRRARGCPASRSIGAASRPAVSRLTCLPAVGNGSLCS
jgi:hypothetical protein